MICKKKISNYSYITAVSVLPILFLNVSAQEEVAYRLDAPKNINEFHVVTTFMMTMIILSWCGCFYVFYRTYKQWILDKKRLKMIHRLPLYTAFSDFLINSIYFVNIIHTSLFAEVWGQPECNIISAINWAFLTINLSLYGVVALSTYIRICHEIYLHRGKYDYKLWSLIIFVSVIFQLINIPNHGPRKYWCTGKKGQIVSNSILLCMISMMLIIIFYCYCMTLRSILAQQNLLEEVINDKFDQVEDNERRRVVERRAAKKIISYIFVFMIQWTPVQINIISRYIKNHDTWNFILASGVMFGGIGNAFNYILNEGWISRKSSTEIEASTIDTSHTTKGSDINSNYENLLDDDNLNKSAV